MLGTQLDLFPEPTRTETEPTEYRWTVLEADDEDEDLEDEDDEILIAVDERDDLEILRDDYDEDAYLRDNLTGRVYDPYEWPEDDAVDHAALHVINTLTANGHLSALADYQRNTLAPVKS
jgi:hypothetical protein